jgi:hypothetical protein
MAQPTTFMVNARLTDSSRQCTDHSPFRQPVPNPPSSRRARNSFVCVLSDTVKHLWSCYHARVFADTTSDRSALRILRGWHYPVYR